MNVSLYRGIEKGHESGKIKRETYTAYIIVNRADVSLLLSSGLTIYSLRIAVNWIATGQDPEKSGAGKLFSFASRDLIMARVCLLITTILLCSLYSFFFRQRRGSKQTNKQNKT